VCTVLLRRNRRNNNNNNNNNTCVRRLREIVRRLETGLVDNATLVDNLQYAAAVLEHVYKVETTYCHHSVHCPPVSLCLLLQLETKYNRAVEPKPNRLTKHNLCFTFYSEKCPNRILYCEIMLNAACSWPHSCSEGSQGL